MIPLSRSILWLRSLPAATSSLPALVGLRAAAVIAPLADAFDAAADAAALTLLTRSADVVSGAKAQKARVSLSLARHPHLRPMPSQQRPDVKNSHRRCSYKDRRVTSNSTGLLRRRTWTEFLKTVCIFIYWPIHAISDPKTSENVRVTGTWPQLSRHVPHVFL